ncbi:MAG: TIGR02996 domain-containing protein [Deltaproteobacteria bacterium]|nr:TIGR02996 domain-containing protein [Deltaproteobacteria bacterium]
MIKLELEGKKLKWTTLDIVKSTVSTKSGGNGLPTKDASKKYGTPAKAKAAYDAAVADLIAKGYRDPMAPGAAPTKITPRNAALEAAIRANREDAGPYQVYADWLQQQGSPVGELIVLSQANKKAAVAKIIDKLGLPGKGLATFGWRHGMWQWLRLENSGNWMDNKFDAVALSRSVFSQPMCAALEELRIGILRWEQNYLDVPAVLAEAKKRSWAADLPKLKLGDVDSDIDMAHHQIGDVGKPISKAFPKLRQLTLHSSAYDGGGTTETFGLSGLDLPELRELVIETCSMSKKRLTQVLAAKLPKLEKLELWFGTPNYDGDANIKGLTKLLAGAVFGTVKHLGLRNAEFQNAIAIAIASSKIAGRLESLDLSMGTMTDVGAEALISSASSFGKLKALNVGKNFLSPAGIRAVKKAFKYAVTADQKEADDSIEGETHYYVSVAE